MSENKKYRFTGVSKMHEGTEVHQIESLVDMPSRYGDIRKGDLGGFIESESNLSTDPYNMAWVGHRDSTDKNNRKVEKAGVVMGDAHISVGGYVAGGAVVSGDSVITESLVHENSIVESSNIHGHSFVRAGAIIKDSKVLASDANGATIVNSNINESELDYSAVENSKVDNSELGTYSIISHSSAIDSKLTMESNLTNSKINNGLIEQGYKVNNEIVDNADELRVVLSDKSYDISDYEDIINKHRVDIENDNLIVSDDGQVVDQDKSVSLTDSDLEDLNNLEDEQGLNQ